MSSLKIHNNNSKQITVVGRAGEVRSGWSLGQITEGVNWNGLDAVDGSVCNDESMVGHL